MAADIKLTFDDGSYAYLEHYGVLGMKWGVRNEETLRKYAGGGGPKPTKRQVKSVMRKKEKEYRKLSGDKRMLGKNTKAVQEAHRKAISSDNTLKKYKKEETEAKTAYEMADRRSKRKDYLFESVKNNSTSSPFHESATLLAEVNSEIGKLDRQDASDRYANTIRKVDKRTKTIGKKYVRAYEDAAVKDLGFENIERGRALLKEYGLMKRATRSQHGVY